MAGKHNLSKRIIRLGEGVFVPHLELQGFTLYEAIEQAHMVPNRIQIIVDHLRLKLFVPLLRHQANHIGVRLAR
jgi:hypothetical protein